jgi:hypothetical protein
MKLSIKERIELTRILRRMNSDSTSDVELAKGIFDKADISQQDRIKFGITETPTNYHIDLDPDQELVFTTPEIAMLKKVHGILEKNSMVNLDNLSLLVKIRDIEVKEKESA